jgi:hypothetical protein
VGWGVSFMPVDLDAPGVRVHCMDPPVFTVESFLADSVCEVRASICGPCRRLTFRFGAATTSYAPSVGHCSLYSRG